MKKISNVTHQDFVDIIKNMPVEIIKVVKNQAYWPHSILEKASVLMYLWEMAKLRKARFGKR